jgi:heme-degrading monooxygenase HmoA
MDGTYGMVVTVFRSRLRDEHAQPHYEMSARMRMLAEKMPGFIGFKTFRADDGERVSLIEFESEDTLRAWREHPEHGKAQELGRTKFYAEFQIQVCSIIRQYGSKPPMTNETCERRPA